MQKEAAAFDAAPAIRDDVRTHCNYDVRADAEEDDGHLAASTSSFHAVRRWRLM